MMGTAELIEIEAKILPDRVYIQDMLTDYEQYWDVSTENEFENSLAYIKK